MEIFMNKNLLVDVMTFEVRPEMIEESIEKNNGKLIVTGVIQRANAKNQNGRIYPKAILEREVAKYNQLVHERRSIGELDHPDSSVINLANVSHLLSELHWEGDDVVGSVEILSTPSGNILKALFKSGVAIGISSRGLGSVEEIGESTVRVKEDYEILCWDMVSNPSTQGSFMHPLTEGVNPEIQPNKYGKVNQIILDILTDLNMAK
jgi:hypothetical protein